MARFSRLKVYGTLLDSGIVPLFHQDDPDVAFEVVRAVAEGGVPVIEFTNRGDRAHEVFAQVAKRCAGELPEVVLGAGSIVDVGTAALYINLGAAFVVAPTFDQQVASVCNRRRVAYVPGCATATEIGRAEEAGCEIVKIFPGGAVGGPSFISALLGPSPGTRVMPTGGIEPTTESLRAWFSAGAACVGMGSGLLRRDLVEAGDWEGLREDVARTASIVAELRPGI